MLNHGSSVVEPNPEHLIPHLVREEMESFLGFVDLLCLLGQHEWERELSVFEQDLRPLHEFVEPALVLPLVEACLTLLEQGLLFQAQGLL